MALIRAFFLLLFIPATLSHAQSEIEVTFSSSGTLLSGTLRLPSAEGTFRAVVLAQGSGKQTRDERYLREIGDEFLRRGVAVLAYDKRGCGKSGGAYDPAESFEVLSGDLAAAVARVRKQPTIRADEIGLWGLSQGGWLAEMVAARDPRIQFLILVSTPAVNTLEQVLTYLANTERERGVPELAVRQIMDARRAVYTYYGTGKNKRRAEAAFAKARRASWYKYYREDDELEHVANEEKRSKVMTSPGSALSNSIRHRLSAK